MTHNRLRPMARLLIVDLILGLALACNAPSLSPTTVLPAATVTLAAPSPTAIPPTPTATAPAPTLTPPTATVPPSATPSTMMVNIFLIALEDNGQSGQQVGCGDSAVPVQVEVPYTQGVLRAALESLLSIREQFYGESGLYNSLYQSDLQVENVVIEDGVATINLSGTLMLGGVCDNPRVKAQIEETALQFSTVSEVHVFINGIPLEELLSQEG